MLSEALIVGVLAGVLCAALGDARLGAGPVDLREAVVVAPAATRGPASQCVPMLLDEVEKRARIRWRATRAAPAGTSPLIVVGTTATLSRTWPDVLGALPPPKPGADGYRLGVARRGYRAVVVVAGNDERGALFGVGCLLRSLRMTRDSVMIDGSLRIATAPRTRIRGHQLGYRPKTNSYDAWSEPMWEQYIRDLVVFGTNAVELIPPRSDDAPDSPHFPLPQMEMMIRMSAMLDRYGLDVWIWYPALDPDYSKPETVAAALKEWGDVLDRLPRVDALFVPGGDPGHTKPSVLMAMLEKMAPVLHRKHPRAGIWVAPQGFSQEWLDEFIGILRTQPRWLAGVVFGPQLRVPLSRLREMVPERYPIRHYPDITHMRQCQYAVPDWDLAYALTEGREAINPRPIDQATIFRQTDPYTVGFIAYSEGCNDDVNKIVWSALGWDPTQDVRDILVQYARYFISDRCAEPFADGLMELERNWRGPVAANEGIEGTLAAFQALERTTTLQEKLNWRFQQALYRAYYDALVRRRAILEEGLEKETLAALAEAPVIGADEAARRAEAILLRAGEPVAPDLRARVFELAEALYQSIRMQLSTSRYMAIGTERGANLDSIDAPLNNAAWIRTEVTSARSLPEEAKRVEALLRIAHWTDPGPGGFYDEPGHPDRRAHVVMGPGFDRDPGCYESVRVGFSGNPRRLSWTRYAETLYDQPLRMRYTGLDPKASYRVRVVYGTDGMSRKLRLVAGNELEVHPWMLKPNPATPQEFDIPSAAYADGALSLTWTAEPGYGSNGRCCQISEVWLLRVR